MNYLFTVNVGGYEPQLPTVRPCGMHCVAIVDKFYTGGHNGWALVEAERTGEEDPVRLSRKAKMMPDMFCPMDEGVRYAYVDSSFIPVRPEWALEQLLPEKFDMGLLLHPRRDNPRQEISALTHRERKLISQDEAVRIEQLWQKRRFPYLERRMHIGGVLFRKNNEQVRAFNQAWFTNFVQLRIPRDQLTLDLTLWEAWCDTGLLWKSWPLNYHFDKHWGFCYTPKVRRPGK